MILKIFLAKKSAEKFVVLSQNCRILQKLDNNIGFKEKCQFFRRKLMKIIIDPREVCKKNCAKM
jgi:hypothetical protein